MNARNISHLIISMIVSGGQQRSIPPALLYEAVLGALQSPLLLCMGLSPGLPKIHLGTWDRAAEPMAPGSEQVRVT